MRYKTLYNIALKLDEWIGDRPKIPHHSKVIEFLNRLCEKPVEDIGRGAYKRGYKIQSNKNFVVLKIGHPAYIERDFKAINEYAKGRKGFQKHYWHTKYCALQRFLNKFDANDPVLNSKLQRLRTKGKRLGYRDIRPGNVGIDKHGRVKTFDVTYTRDT